MAAGFFRSLALHLLLQLKSIISFIPSVVQVNVSLSGQSSRFLSRRQWKISRSWCRLTSRQGRSLLILNRGVLNRGCSCSHHARDLSRVNNFTYVTHQVTRCRAGHVPCSSSAFV
ncbi:Hypothetical_protein [Hexamita inflata]|uniref:Hypothetical_protein n=1 Tax=Hexamita inflata TaxID=28002 RepID=A0AA86UN83_9EUKA|nr:Hypothetical protein HINF_LOCUS45601 [Hexamita inflata]